MIETELAKPIISWLEEQHWDVYQEVQFSYGGCIADIVAVRNKILWIIETKTTFGLAVLEQATRWPVHYRSVGVPWARNRDYRVAKYYYKVGVLEVGKYNKDVREVEHPPLFSKDKRLTNYYISKLTNLHKTFAPAGSQSGNHLTPYKQTMMEVRKVISSNPGCDIGFLYKQLGNMHYSSSSSFKGSLLTALNDFEKWCKIDRTTKPYKLYVLDN